MPANVNGFGTAFIGEEWVIGFGIPLVPLKTFRVLGAPRNDVNGRRLMSVAFDRGQLAIDGSDAEQTPKGAAAFAGRLR